MGFFLVFHLSAEFNLSSRVVFCAVGFTFVLLVFNGLKFVLDVMDSSVESSLDMGS